MSTLIIVYAIFNYIVTVATGKPIYPIVTWKDSKSIIMIAINVFITLIAFAAFLLISKLRYRRYRIKVPSEDEEKVEVAIN